MKLSFSSKKISRVLGLSFQPYWYKKQQCSCLQVSMSLEIPGILSTINSKIMKHRVGTGAISGLHSKLELFKYTLPASLRNNYNLASIVYV